MFILKNYRVWVLFVYFLCSLFHTPMYVMGLADLIKIKNKLLQKISGISYAKDKAIQTLIITKLYKIFVESYATQKNNTIIE